MPTKPLFSVIMPVYNSEKYLKEAIQSVMDQSFSDWELLIIDDGSTDSSYEIANSFGLRDERIQLWQHENKEHKGVSASRNLGVERSNGQWIAFLDADDIWFENKLDAIEEVLSKNNDLAFIYSQATVIETNYSGSVKKTKYISGIPGLMKEPFIKTLGGLSSATPSVVMRKDVFIKAGGFNEKFAFSEDTLLFHKALLFGDLYFIDEPLVQVRYHDHSTKSNTDKEVMTNARLDVYLELMDVGAAKPYLKDISHQAVTTGMERVWKFFFSNPFSNGSILLSSLGKVWSNKQILVKHKLVALLLPLLIVFKRISMSPSGGGA